MLTNLPKILEKHLKGKFEIKKLFLVKLSCCVYIPYKEEDDYYESFFNKILNGLDNDEDNKMLNHKFNTDDIINCLKKHQNIFDIKLIDKDDKRIMLTRIGCESFLLLDKLFSFKVHIPERLQKLASFKDLFGAELIEEFNVLSNGSLFLSYADITSYPFLSVFGQELRDLIDLQIKEETTFCTLSFGPNPFRQDIYVIFLSVEPESLSVNSFVANDDLFIISSKEYNPEDFMTSLFRLIQHHFIRFYSQSLLKTEIGHIHELISANFNNLFCSIQRQFSTPWFRFIKRNNDMKQARDALSILYKLCTELENKYLIYNKERTGFLNGVMQNELMNKLIEIFKKETNLEKLISNNLYQSLKFYEGQVSSSFNVRGVIIGSLLTAIIGLIGAILAILLK